MPGGINLLPLAKCRLGTLTQCIILNCRCLLRGYDVQYKALSWRKYDHKVSVFISPTGTTGNCNTDFALAVYTSDFWHNGEIERKQIFRLGEHNKHVRENHRLGFFPIEINQLYAEYPELEECIRHELLTLSMLRRSNGDK